MVELLRKGDGGLFSAHADREGRSTRVDREIPIAEPAHEIEGLARGLLLRQAKRIGRDRRLDRRAHLRRGAEEAVRRRQALNPLVRALEVVVLNKERRAALAVIEVAKHRAGEKLLPHRLPEALDLAAGLRMMRAALDVPDALAAKLLFKARRAAPGRVLAPLVGQDLARRAVVGDAARKRLQHERAPLVMRHHQAHQVARVIVQERRHVHPLMAPKEKREEIRLPQLVGLGALEALRRRPRPGFRHRAFFDQALLLQHPAHRRVGGPDAEEAPHHVADAPAARLRLGLLCRDHCLTARIALRRTVAVTHRRARFGA